MTSSLSLKCSIVPSTKTLENQKFLSHTTANPSAVVLFLPSKLMSGLPTSDHLHCSHPWPNHCDLWAPAQWPAGGSSTPHLLSTVHSRQTGPLKSTLDHVTLLRGPSEVPNTSKNKLQDLLPVPTRPQPKVFFPWPSSCWLFCLPLFLPSLVLTGLQPCWTLPGSAAIPQTQPAVSQLRIVTHLIPLPGMLFLQTFLWPPLLRFLLRCHCLRGFSLFNQKALLHPYSPSSLPHFPTSHQSQALILLYFLHGTI